MGSENKSQQPDWLKPRGARWQAAAPTRLHDNPWFAVDHYEAVAPTGAPADYYVHDQKAWATGVVPLHEDGTVTLVGQWRFPFGSYWLEIPEGGAPKNEHPLDGAKRELAEGAHLQAAQWRDILRLQLSNASSNEVAYCYLATGLSPCTDHAADATEDLAVVRVTFAEALEAAASGQIQDAMTVASLLRVHHMAIKGDLDPALAQRVLG